MFANVTKYYKALIAFVAPLVLLLTFFSTSPEITAAAPSVVEWLVVVGIPAVTGLLTWLKRNEPTIVEAQKALDRATARGI